jgi:hypothetical protein
MDGKGRTTSFWGYRITKMPSLEEKIKLKKHSYKQCRFLLNKKNNNNKKKTFFLPVFFLLYQPKPSESHYIPGHQRVGWLSSKERRHNFCNIFHV